MSLGPSWCRFIYSDLILLLQVLNFVLGTVPQVWTPRPSHFLTLTEAKRKAEAIEANNSKIAKIDFSLLPLFPDAKKRKLVAKTEAEENMVVKIKNFSNSGHQSSLPVEQRATINNVEPVKIEADKNPENVAVKSEIDDDIVVLE